MSRVLTIGMLMTLAAAAGFYGPRFMSDSSYAEFRTNFPDPDPQFAAEFTIDRGWGCTGITTARAYEDRFAKTPAGVAESGLTEGGFPITKYALSLTQDRKGILILSEFQLHNDVTAAGEPIPITYADSGGKYIVANRVDGSDITSIILDLTTLKGIISFTSMLEWGLKGRSILVSCK
jgi:hypothetical protein